jgi:HIRAN domain
MLLRRVTSLVLLFLGLNCEAEENRVGHVRMLVQDSPLAGSQYHEVDAHWELLTVGDALTLVREPQNRHDAQAVQVLWQGHLLGYVPRRENKSVTAALDGGEVLTAKITALQPNRNPWLRVRFGIYLEL